MKESKDGMVPEPKIQPENQEILGLTEAEAAERRSRGLGNRVAFQSTRTYGQILRENLFTFVNITLFSLGFALILLRRTSDALVSVGVILVNVIVNIIQEIRAKRILDHIALITRPRATVLREGVRKSVDPSEIVVGDILVVEPGDQIVVDGSVVSAGRLEIDESLLTGESDPILKHTGDEVFSGSFCLTGSGLYQAQKVGSESLSARMTASARAFRRMQTPLQQQINLVIRVLLVVAVYFEILQLVNAAMERMKLVEIIQMSVVVLGLIPNGLFLAIAAAYTIGAVRIARKGALVQQANAIESLSNVDLICLDKTGTLTTNRLYFDGAHPQQLADDEFRQRLGDFTASISSRNPTAAAIAAACPGKARCTLEEIPFSSAYKWSGLAVDDPAFHGVYILGAPEILNSSLGEGLDLAAKVEPWTDQGLRVVAFAYSPHIQSLRDPSGMPCLPHELALLGFITLGDELRPGMRQTLEAFQKAGVRLKIISGDNPGTVAALARQAGFEINTPPVSGLELAQMDAAEMDRVVEQANIFGRVTPQQKEQMVKSLRNRGNYVAMVGDGVNDVLSLKQANLAIALQSGSQATRSVADLILLDDSFTVLPEVLSEGQRILNGMQDILKLFLTRILYVALLILSTGFVGSFPLSPKNSSILSLFSVGVPSLALAIWARPGLVPHGNLIRRMIRFFLPAGLTLSLAGLLVFLGYLLVPPLLAGQLIVGGGADIDLSKANLPNAQAALTTFSIFCSLILLPFVEPPSRAWVGGDHLSGDRRPFFLAVGLLAFYFFLVLNPMLRRFFELTSLGGIDYLILGAAAALWAVILRWVWRSRVLDHFLSVDFMKEG
jgi:cation-transporting P-type ATPase E